jgi:hypothetical protein
LLGARVFHHRLLKLDTPFSIESFAKHHPMRLRRRFTGTAMERFLTDSTPD